MPQCSASYALEHAPAETWPSGNWLLCRNDGVKARFVPISPDCLVMVHLCDAHFDAWEIRNEAIRGLLGI